MFSQPPSLTPSAPPSVRGAGARPRLPSIQAAAIVLFPIRIFLGFGWMRAGVEKFMDESWWDGTHLAGFLTEQRSAALPFMAPVIDHVFVPLVEPISLLVMLMQFAIALGFVTTRLLRPALYAGILLNVAFVLLGAVNPSVFYLVIELSLLAALNIGLLGNDPRPPSTISVGAKFGVALACAPYITTLHPADVIDDPAIILATVAAISAATESLRWLNSDGPIGIQRKTHTIETVCVRFSDGRTRADDRARSWR